MIGDELRRQADQFVELTDIAGEFTRRQAEPRTPRAPIRGGESYTEAGDSN